MIKTVRDLKKLLSKFDDDSKIWISVDEEGNSFHTIDDDVFESDGYLILYPNQSTILTIDFDENNSPIITANYD